MKIRALTISLFLLLAAPAFAAPIDDVLKQFPAKTIEQEEKLSAQIVQDKLIAQVLEHVAPPGAVDDSSARYAVAALTRYIAKQGVQPDRDTYEQTLIDELAKAGDPDIKCLFIQQLQFTGRDRAVPALAGYLLDQDINLSNCAAAALVQIGDSTQSAPAGQAVAKALESAPATHIALLIKAAGDLRDTAASQAVLKYCSSDDPAIRAQALYAAAMIPVPDAAETLAKAAEARGLGDRSRNTALYLLFAERLGETRHASEAAQICRGLISSRDGEAHIQAAALSTLVQVAGAQAMADILTAVGSPDQELRNAALETSLKIKDADLTQKLMEKARTASPQARVDLIHNLGLRRDTAARPIVTGMISDKDPEVRTAAITALVALAGPDATADLVGALQHADDIDARLIAQCLGRMPGDAPLAAAAAALPKLPPGGAVAVLDVLLARGARSQVAAVLEQTHSQSAPVRSAAIRALARTASEKDLPAILDLAMNARSDADQSAALKAAVMVAAPIADENARSAAILAVLPKAQGPRRAALLRVLAKVGGRPALAAIEADLKNPATFDAAARALAETSDAAAVPALLAIAQDKSTDTAHYVLALRAAIDLSKSQAPEQRLSTLRDAYASARRSDEKKLVLASLATIRSAGALDLVMPALDDADLKQEASLAALKMILPPRPNQPHLNSPHLREALEKAIPNCPDPRLKDQATRVLKTLPPA